MKWLLVLFVYFGPAAEGELGSLVKEEIVYEFDNLVACEIAKGMHSYDKHAWYVRTVQDEMYFCLPEGYKF